MSNEQIKTILSELLPNAVYDENGEWLNISIEASAWKELARQLRFNPQLNFDYLFCVTGVDWKTHLSMVYHLASTTHRSTVVVKVKLAAENEIETVSDIWRTAEFHEREVYDLLGVKFIHHPDLRRLFLTDEWVGHPLRKDYEDPINMIKL